MMRPDLKAFKQFLKAQDKLKVYTPADTIYTSDEEIKYISDILDLKSMTLEEMSLMRSFIVLYYEHLREGLDTNSDAWERYWQGMLSVTASIDYVSNGGTA